jgi:hypothetical protein
VRLAETFGAVSRTGEGVAEGDRVTPEGYIKSVDVALAVELPASVTRDPLATLKAEHGKPVSPFEIGFVAAVHVVPSISNRDTNVNAVKERAVAIALARFVSAVGLVISRLALAALL